MPDFAMFLNWGIGICAVMTIIWLIRIKTKKLRAVVMAFAFIAFALLLFFVRQEASQGVIVGAGVLLFALLAIDAGLRFSEIKDVEEEKDNSQ